VGYLTLAISYENPLIVCTTLLPNLRVKFAPAG
jgi:hypothetical protein